MTPTPDIATRLAPPTTQPGLSPDHPAEKSGTEHGSNVSSDFQAHLDNTNNVQQVNATPTDQLNSVESTQRVNPGQIPDKQDMLKQDMFGQFDKIRTEFDAFLKRSGQLDQAVAEGKLKFNDPKVVQQRREEMRMLLHFQGEMQSTAMKVEIASKVISGSADSTKQVLSTPA
jgi:hypothetical protein